ncbi:MAG: hypothetical protein J07HQW1_02162 [Haloquadratum walsbyi J07HQW1]|uniref:Uncharacterized protein n=1 Tax=Haloquadratum walsbyi J07HQW1 TaxID=1238424 RepID=U1PES8_9EURY|nr:MAG: hypothetical protein J07HQW1_02162 [Haloquadratum walsbyi J07HQW1]
MAAAATVRVRITLGEAGEEALASNCPSDVYSRFWALRRVFR